MKLNPKITYGGYGILVNALSGTGIEFTKVELGSGSRSNHETATTLASRVMNANITAITKGDNFITLEIHYDNYSLDTAFNVTEIGVYARNTGGQEVLYAYSSDTADVQHMPSRTSSRIVESTVYLVVAIGSAENVTAILSDQAMYASKTAFENHINDHNNPHQVTKEQVGLGNVDNTPFYEHVLADYTKNSTLDALTNSDTLRNVIRKIGKAVVELKNHLIDRNNPHKVTCSQIGAATADHTHDDIAGADGDYIPRKNGTKGITGVLRWDVYDKAGDESVTGIEGLYHYSNPKADFSATGYDAERWRIAGYYVGEQDSYLEIATGDNMSEPIIVRQYGYSTRWSEDEAIEQGKDWSRYSNSRTAYLLNKNGETVFPGRVSGYAFNTTSDRKRKKNIEDIDANKALAFVRGLDSVRFNLDSESSKTCGFIAQDVFELMQKVGICDTTLYRARKAQDPLSDSEIAQTPDENIEWTLDYTQFIPYLVSAFQSLDERISELERGGN